MLKNMDFTKIKLELSKACLTYGTNLETAKKFFDWIIEETELPDAANAPAKYDNIPIEQLANKTRARTTILNRCRENNINTIGDLLRCGREKFRSFSLVGMGTVSKVEDVLYDDYNIEEW